MYTNYVDPCLRGFTQTIPPVEEWNKYEVLDVDGGSFLYPELMFTCSGTLNSVTIPYSTIAGVKWDNILELSIEVWRRLKMGGYAKSGKVTEVSFKVSVTKEPSTTDTVQGNVTTHTASFNTEKNDIIRLVAPPNITGKRDYIPVLLTDHRVGNGEETIVLPIIQIDFVPDVEGEI